jgi:plasmid stabilization system protein ParE
MAGNAGVLKVIQRNEGLDQAASSRQDARSAVASLRQMGMGAKRPGVEPRADWRLWGGFRTKLPAVSRDARKARVLVSAGKEILD